jgi:hypothetical protein
LGVDDFFGGVREGAGSEHRERLIAETDRVLVVIADERGLGLGLLGGELLRICGVVVGEVLLLEVVVVTPHLVLALLLILGCLAIDGLSVMEGLVCCL